MKIAIAIVLLQVICCYYFIILLVHSMPDDAPTQVLPTNPCKEQITDKNGNLVATCVRGFIEERLGDNIYGIKMFRFSS